MKNRLHKRLSAWLLTLVMLVGMLPAMASADEVGEDLAPPAPQEENYGYVRLVFAEGEQAREAEAAGADIVGSDDLVAEV